MNLRSATFNLVVGYVLLAWAGFFEIGLNAETAAGLAGFMVVSIMLAVIFGKVMREPCFSGQWEEISTMSSLLKAALEMPRLLVGQVLRPIRIAMRGPMPHPKTQRELADLVDNSLKHEIRAGYTHRLIPLMFVTVGERVFCRRYSYGEPSWHSVFQTDPAGQVKLDETVVNIEARVPQDLDEIVPDVDQAYADALKKLGASYMLAGATEPRAQESTMEVRLAEPSASAA